MPGDNERCLSAGITPNWGLVILNKMTLITPVIVTCVAL